MRVRVRRGDRSRGLSWRAGELRRGSLCGRAGARPQRHAMPSRFSTPRCPEPDGGGAGGGRTRDLVNAIHARSQLRHSPTGMTPCCHGVKRVHANTGFRCLTSIAARPTMTSTRSSDWCVVQWPVRAFFVHGTTGGASLASELRFEDSKQSLSALCRISRHGQSGGCWCSMG